MKRYRPLIDHNVFNTHSNYYEKDDIRQIVMMSFLTAIRTYKAEKNIPFSSYAAACVKNSVRQILRDSNSQKRKGMYTVVSIDDEHMVSDKRLSYDDSYLVTSVMQAEAFDLMKRILSESELEVFVYSLSGYQYNEIAKILNLSRKQVDNAIFRAKKKLAEYYDPGNNE
ncbi:MAG: sigma-70 family RNA polymerase sigma factor [Eubacteriaceae bacterium]|nr:sigma-70 family RNA polymerase sigma factor [Eubacteriaceae bacterium]